MNLLVDNLALHLRIAGVLLLLLAAVNLLVPKRFNWAAEMRSLSLLNRQIFLVHMGFIVLILLLFAALLLTCTQALLVPGDALARAVLAGLAIFWFARLLTQWFVYDSALWRGHRFNTFMHVAFSVLWSYFTLVFAAALWVNVH